MNRVFYGICSTATATNYKNVVVSDKTLLEDGFKFQKGDLLVVFFAAANTAAAPSLVIYVGDTEQEISTTIDSGKYVKTHDVDADAAGAWGAGETVIFCYTQQGTSNIYYWELINAAHASQQIYGVTKLFGSSNIDMSTWLNTTDDTDYTTALTPGMLKKFFQSLSLPTDSSDSSQQEGDTPGATTIPIVGLNWVPSNSVADLEMDTLGTLSLSSGGNGINITYPINALINNKFKGTTIPTHTGDLVNNGNTKNKAAGEPFITRMVPNNLYFTNGNGLYYKSGDNNIPRIVLNDNNYITIGSTSDNTLSGIKLNGAVNVTGNEQVIGAITASNAITGGSFVTASTSKAKEFIENNISLVDKYSPQLVVEKWTSPVITIAKGSSCGHQHFTPSKSGYTPMCVVSFNVNYANAKSTGDAKYANVWECYYVQSGTYKGQVEYSMYNLKNAAITVTIDIYVLYKKNI